MMNKNQGSTDPKECPFDPKNKKNGDQDAAN